MVKPKSMMCPFNMNRQKVGAIPDHAEDRFTRENKRYDSNNILDTSSASTAYSTIVDSQRSLGQFSNSNLGQITINEDDAVSSESQDTCTPDASKKTSKFKKQAVSFDQVSIREYPRTIGDHPDVGLGPPVTIDWEYCDLDSLPVDDYESSRAPRKSFPQLRLHPNTRNRMLLESGVSKEDIKAGTKAANKAQKQRTATNSLHECTFVCALETIAQSAKRKIKRRSWRSSTSV